MMMLKKNFRDSLVAGLSLLAASFLGGCKSYQMGHPAELPF